MSKYILIYHYTLHKNSHMALVVKNTFFDIMEDPTKDFPCIIDYIENEESRQHRFVIPFNVLLPTPQPQCKSVVSLPRTRRNRRRGGVRNQKHK